ncbi:MAG TPA: hypothetical protein VFX85_07685 [Solirubrobacterales bacterium]|nr:hypothetical protein [Solirubrobacterales bacterium]
MPEWPPIDEPELLERLGLDDAGFGEYLRALAERLPARPYEPELLARALEYPWARPPGSYLLSGEGAELLAAMEPERHERTVAEYSGAASGRLPLLAIGSNAAPAVLARKFAHFGAAADRALLALSGRLHEFDVGAAAQPALYGALPATLFPSPGTAVAATLLWVTPAQFTQLTWSELSYRLGRLRTRFAADEGGGDFGAVLVFVSRFGSLCLDGEPVAMAAVPASGRSAPALTQEQLLDAVAARALGPGADAEALVRAVHEDLGGLVPRLAATVHGEAQRFESERWAPFRRE